MQLHVRGAGPRLPIVGVLAEEVRCSCCLLPQVNRL